MEKVTFTKERETNLITLYCKAALSKKNPRLFHDPWAEEAVNRIDYDFSRFKNINREIMIPMRSKKFDIIVQEFIAAHPDAIVLHLGCGMDSRVFRVDPPATVQWFDVDYPDVIDLRVKLFPAKDHYRMIGSSLTDLNWLDEIPNGRPAMIVLEGVTMYLTEETVKTLLHTLVSHFPSGEIAFDTHSTTVVKWMARRMKSVHNTDAVFRWGIAHPDDVMKLEPALTFVKAFGTSELPEYKLLPFKYRLASRIMRTIPSLRRMMVPLVYRF